MILLQLQEGGHASLVVTGNSMYPTLSHGRDTVFLQPVEGQLQKGDLILYRRENGDYVLHRIVRCPSLNEWVCSGDNQWEPERVCREQAVAKVYSFCRKGKEYAVTAQGYRCYVWLWVCLFPIRRPILAVRRFFGRLYRVVFK